MAHETKTKLKPAPASAPADVAYPFNEWSFIYPARPENKVPVALLDFYETQGFWGQYKKNGTCSTVGIGPNGRLYSFTRHKDEPHRAWQFTPNTAAIADFVPSDSFTVFAVELLHSKGPLIKDTFYIWDIFVHQSAFLIGTTFAERQALLTKIFPHPIDETDSHYVMTNNIWLAKPIVRDLEGAWKKLKASASPLDEGLVLKNPTGVLEPLYRDGNNQGWQVKCRVMDTKKRIGF
jgi:hypothetical protein